MVIQRLFCLWIAISKSDEWYLMNVRHTIAILPFILKLKRKRSLRYFEKNTKNSSLSQWRILLSLNFGTDLNLRSNEVITTKFGNLLKFYCVTIVGLAIKVFFVHTVLNRCFYSIWESSRPRLNISQNCLLKRINSLQCYELIRRCSPLMLALPVTYAV